MSWKLFYKNFWCKGAIVNDVRNSGDSPKSYVSDLFFVTAMENQRAGRHGVRYNSG